MSEMDRILKMEDYDKMGDMSKIKKSLKSCMDMDLLVRETSRIIDESKSFKFRSERSKKFIDRNDPTFILVCEAIDFNRIDKNSINEVNNLTNKVTDLIKSEIINNISDFITNSVIDKDKFNDLFKNLPEEFASTLISNIFIIRLSVTDNTVIFKYFI